jgi:SAM-dependent methyltransferase
MSFIPTAYSENASLRIFLDSLSYHKVGARFFASKIAELEPPKSWSLLDVGCGEAQFTKELLAELSKVNCLPKTVNALDPDADNLKQYSSRLKSFRKLSVRHQHAGVENFNCEKCFIVICSHSLYQTFENPNLGSREKDSILRNLLRHVDKGALLISLASEKSHAYKYKRQILNDCGELDRSVFGENLAQRFGALKLPFEQTLHDSYMDVTNLIEGDDAKLFGWTQYFCRLSTGQVNEIGAIHLRAVLESLAIKFSDLPIETQKSYQSAPAACGSPLPDSMILPHREVFIVSRDSPSGAR